MDKRQSLILFSTSDLASGRRFELDRMIQSVAKFRHEVPSCEVRLLILFQNANGRMLPNMPDWVEAHSCTGQIPLSNARNSLLRLIDWAAVDETAVMAFPDDDAWYPDISLDFMCRKIAADDTVDFAFCRYGSDAGPPDGNVRSRTASLQKTLSFASSNTMFLRANLARKIGLFDEGLGLGTAARAGEDTDYAMRGWHEARSTVFIDAKLIGHRDNDAEIKHRYFPGSLGAIYKNRKLSFSTRIAYLRKLCVGFIYATSRKIDWNSLIGKIR